MSGKTSIEWTDRVWNPVAGCSKVSEGCRNCYAETVDKRFAAQWGHEYMPWTAANAAHNVRLHEDRLEQPLRWQRPRKIFVNSMSDLFHEQVPDEFIRRVFAVMGEAHWHTFQILTKRPERMKELLNSFLAEKDFATWTGGTEPPFPWSNIWLGVSVENQQTADERIPLLLQTPAAVRFLSMEPLLGSVDLRYVRYEDQVTINALTGEHEWEYPAPNLEQRIHWVIVGGESGSNARPMHPEWVRNLQGQCMEAGVPFFFKSWGEWESMPDQPWEVEPKGNCRIINLEGGSGFHGAGAMWTKRVGKKKAGRLLDGRTWDEVPITVMRIADS